MESLYTSLCNETIYQNRDCSAALEVIAEYWDPQGLQLSKCLVVCAVVSSLGYIKFN
jgi:hypothetical protein